jgi:hypothetical protein
MAAIKTGSSLNLGNGAIKIKNFFTVVTADVSDEF